MRRRVDDLVWRSFDPALPRRLKRLTEATSPVYTRPVSFTVTARTGAPLQLVAYTADGLSAAATGTIRLEPAQQRCLDETFLREHLGKLGGTPFHVDTVTLESDAALFVPVSEINALRRHVVEQLMALRTSPAPRSTYRVVAEALAALTPPAAHAATAQVHVLVRTPEQLEAALTVHPASITLDYLELYGLKPSVERVKAAGIRCRVASPRILKPTEHTISRFLSSLDCELLVRSGGLLYELQMLPPVCHSSCSAPRSPPGRGGAERRGGFPAHPR